MKQGSRCILDFSYVGSIMTGPEGGILPFRLRVIGITYHWDQLVDISSYIEVANEVLVRQLLTQNQRLNCKGVLR